MYQQLAQSGISISSIRYEDIHPEANPVEVQEAPDGQSWRMSNPTVCVVPPCTPSYDSFSSYVHTLTPWESDLLQHVVLDLDPAYISFDLQLYFYAGTDGSVIHETKGAFGWMLSNTEGQRLPSGFLPGRMRGDALLAQVSDTGSSLHKYGCSVERTDRNR